MCVRDPISYLGNDEFLDTIDVENYNQKSEKAQSFPTLEKDISKTKREKKTARVHFVEELVFNEELIKKIYE